MIAAESESELELTVDGEGGFAGFAARSDENADDFAAGGSGTFDATAAVLISVVANGAAGCAAGEAVAAFSVPNAVGGAIETLARFFVPAPAVGGLDARETGAGGVFG